jgi:hypothetical protein
MVPFAHSKPPFLRRLVDLHGAKAGLAKQHWSVPVHKQILFVAGSFGRCSRRKWF